MVSGRLNTVIEQLEYDFNTFELNDFVRHVERLRRREILTLPLPLDLGLSAIWIRARSADYIFYNDRLHPIHKTHNILHEIAHILLGHTCQSIDAVLPPDLMAQLQTEPVQGRLRKADPHLRADVEEQVAEAFVFHIQKRLVNANRMAELMSRSSSIEALERWVETMAFEE